MTHQPLPWLPKNAFEPASFEHALSVLVAEWSEAWFVKVKATCRIKLRSISPGGPAGLSWRRWSGEAVAGIDETGRLALAEAMLDGPIGTNAVAAADRPILNDITDRCLDDLLGRLSWLIDRDRGSEIIAGEPEGLGAAMTWEIGLRKPGATISLMVRQGALVRWRKALAPPSAKPALQSVVRAIQQEPVAISVSLGSSRLSLAEMESLAVGDILELDSRTDDPLSLIAAASIIPIRGRLATEMEGPQLKITEAKKALRP